MDYANHIASGALPASSFMQTSVTNLSTSIDALTVDLADGRTISVPLAWYPRLMHATPRERGNWRLIGDGEGIHWPDIDEDLSVEGLLLGRPSRESQQSLERWLAERAQRQPGKL